mmetsp:Transcript_14289/g.18691  ORF Transcript_14289/g.18691 Transcript_14289/m.18691 type:complete len:92 (-) Transcript_14289:273-548(-)
MSTSQATTKDTKKTDETTTAPSSIVEAIEEDDEFEEFASEAANWDNMDTTANTDSVQWQENWDDDDIEDDFTLALRAELSANNNLQSASTS